LVKKQMREEDFFTAEELAAFREVDRLKALEPIEPVEPVVPVTRSAATAPLPGAATMSEAQSQGWNQWANALIDERMVNYAELFGAEVGAAEKVLRQELAKISNALAVLREEITQVKLENAYLRGLGDRARGEVIDLPALPLPKRNALNG
jgi:hypothetical protein